MSKRFGRNQRRKMREEIAALTESRERITMQFVQERRRANELSARIDDWAREIIQLMGPDNAFNEQVRCTVMTRDIESLGGRLQMTPDPKMTMGLAAPQHVPAMISSYSVITAAVWRLRVSTDEFREQVRVKLVNEQSEPVGYVLSYNHRWTERDVRYISEGIARELTALLNKGRS